MLRIIKFASILAVVFGHPQTIEKHITASCEPPSGTSLIWSNECEMYPDRWFGLSEEKTDAVTAERKCVEAGGKLVSNWNYQLDTCVYHILDAEAGRFTSIEAVIGLQWKPELGYYAWIDEKHNLSSPDAYNTCAGSVCTVEYDNRGMPLESMVASLTNGYYVWQPVGLEAVQHYVCELDCEETVTTTTTTRDFNFTTKPTTPAVRVDKIGYMSATYPTEINVQAVDGAEFQLDNVIAMPSSSNMPKLPYMVYNAKLQEFEVVGDWYYSRNYGYHYFIADDGTATPVNNSNYDGRRSSSFVYTPELGSLMIGGQSSSSSYLSSTIQITPNDVTTNLPSIPIAMRDVSSVYTNSSVICVGGYEHGYYSTSVYQLDLNDLNNLVWKTLTPLKKAVYYATTTVSDGRIFVAGITGYDGIEQYNLQSQTSTFYSDQFDDDMEMACSIISKGVITLFGGYFTSGSNTAYQSSSSTIDFTKGKIPSLNTESDTFMMCATFTG